MVHKPRRTSSLMKDLFLFSTIFPKYLSSPFIIIYLIFKHRLNTSQHDFRKSNCTTTNLVTYLNSIMPSVSSQGQTDSVHFDLSNAFDIVSHNILLRKLSNFGLSSSYVDWFHSYLINRLFCSYFWNPFVLSCLVWSASRFRLTPLLLIYLLMIQVIIFVIPSTFCLLTI
jgi:hypothetical protein